ncbi:MAG TPA: hypothetical protein VMI31_05490, partial [Fimbriimonadaceae bacterium]|nr:hypothetical protein [Fimbriimonadaceae bacterium]
MATVTVPEDDLDGAYTGPSTYEVRWKSGSLSYSASFDVVPRVPSGGRFYFTMMLGGDAPGRPGVGSWDVIQGATIIASSTAPNGWSFWGSFPHSEMVGSPYEVGLQLPQFPANTPLAPGTYEFRYTDGQFNYSATFDVDFSSPTSIVPNPPHGYLQDSMTQTDWMANTVPTDAPEGPGGDTPTASGGPSSALSVDLVHGVVDVDAGPDLVVYNPNGPAVPFERRYRTAMAAGNLASAGMPVGWTHNWDFKIFPSDSTHWKPLQLVYPSGASETLIPHTDSGGQSLNDNSLTIPTGAPYVANGSPSGTTGYWQHLYLQGNGAFRMDFTDSQLGYYRLHQVTNDNGSTLTFGYTNGELTSIVSAQGDGQNQTQLLTLGYTNSGGLLSRATDNITNNYRSYGIDGQYSELLTVSQINGSAAEWTYGYTTINNNQPYLNSVQTTDSNGGSTLPLAAVQYEPLTGRASSLTDAKGNSRQYTYTAFGGAAVSVYDNNSVLQDQYVEQCDSQGRGTSYTTAAGDMTSWGYNNSNPSIPSTIVEPLNDSTTYIADTTKGNLQSAQFQYGDHTNLTWDYTQPSWAPMGTLSRIQEFGNDSTSKAATSYTYYSSTGSGGIVGYLHTSTSPLGAVATYTYTPLGDVSSVTVTDTQSNVLHQTTYGYSQKLDSNGNPIAAAERYGLPYSVTQSVDGNTARDRTTWFDYDAGGRLTAEWDALGNKVAITSNQYDQPTSVTMPLSHTLTLGYASNYGTSTGKPLERAKLQAPDQNGQLATIDSLFGATYDNEAGGQSASDAMSHSNTSTLDPHFDLSTLTDANLRPMHQFAPHPFSRTQDSILGSSTHQLAFGTTFDKNGNVSNRNSPSGTLAGFDGIDASVAPELKDNDIPRQLTYSTTTASPYSGDGYVTVDHDPFGLPHDTVTSSYYTFGGSTVNDSGCQHTYSYNDEDEVTDDMIWNGLSMSPTQTIHYDYNVDGSRHDMYVPIASPQNVTGGYAYVRFIYTYDRLGEVTEIDVNYASSTSDPGTPFTWAKYEYDADGRVTIMRTQKVCTVYTYDALGRLTLLENLTPDFAPDTTVQPLHGSDWVLDPDASSDPHYATDWHTVLSRFTGFTYDAQDNLMGYSIETAVTAGYV